jgi:hypothetical protein
MAAAQKKKVGDRNIGMWHMSSGCQPGKMRDWQAFSLACLGCVVPEDNKTFICHHLKRLNTPSCELI